MIRWRQGVDVLQMLSDAGLTSYWIRKQGIMGQSELQRIRAGGLPSWNTLNWICSVLCYDVGELLEYKPDEATDC